MSCASNRRPPLGGDCFSISGFPSPGAGTVAALHHAFFVDFRDNSAVAREQRFGGAHFGAQWQLAFGQPVSAVLFVFFLAVIGLWAACAVGAFVHLAAGAEIADPRILRRAERTRVEAVAAADAQVLGVQHDAIRGSVEAVDRTDRLAWRISAMHARHRYGSFARFTIIDGDDASAINAPRHFVLVLARGDAGIALDATVGVAKKFHSSHDLLPYAARI